MRLFITVGAFAVVSGAKSEAIPGRSRPVLRHGRDCAPPPGGTRAGVRRCLAEPSTLLWSLRGGGLFPWGFVQETHFAPGGNRDEDVRRGKGRVVTREPPNLTDMLPRRPPLTAPHAAPSSSGRWAPRPDGDDVYAPRGETNRGHRDFRADRVPTAGPPDAAEGTGERRGRPRPDGGSGGGGRGSPSRPPLSGDPRQSQPFAGAAVGPLDRRRTGRVDGFSSSWNRASSRLSETMGGGPKGLMAVHYLVLTCFTLFSISKVIPVVDLLAVQHARPLWWQHLTSMLVHHNRDHLMSNMFDLLVFGSVVEKDMGSVGMLMSFFLCGLVSSFVSLVILPRDTLSLGASGAIFGLYSISVLGKVTSLVQGNPVEGWLRTLIEAAIYGWFVVDRVLLELSLVVTRRGLTGVDHAAHFGGVLTGAVVILVVRLVLQRNSDGRQGRR